MTKLLRSTVQVALAAVAVAAAALIVVPRAMGWQGVLVLTGSMEPALDTGGVAFVDRVRPEAVHVGDVVTFTRAGSTQQLTHRVVEVTATVDGPQFRTKGDANDIADDWVVRPAQLVGKVRFALPHLGGVARLLVTSRQQLALFMAVPALYLIGDDLRRWRAERRRRRQEAEAEAAWAATVAEALATRTRPRRTRVTRVG